MEDHEWNGCDEPLVSPGAACHQMDVDHHIVPIARRVTVDIQQHRRLRGIIIITVIITFVAVVTIITTDSGCPTVFSRK